MAAEPFDSLEKHATRYERLYTAFVKWHGLARDLPSAGNPPLLASMTIGDIDPDEPEFTVHHAGIDVHIRLMYRPGGKDGDSGLLTPYTYDPFRDEPVVLAAIAFNGSGVTGKKFSNGDPIELGRQDGAFHVLGELVKSVLERP